MRLLLPRRSSHLGMQSTRTPSFNTAFTSPMFRQPVTSKVRRNFPKVRSRHRKEMSAPHESRIFSPTTSIVSPCTNTATSFPRTPGSSSRMISPSVFSLTSAGGRNAGSPNGSRKVTLPTLSRRMGTSPPSRARRGLHQGGEDGGGQDVPADDRQVRRRLGGLRFFDHVQHLVHPFRDPLPLYDAVPGD